jgi:hypothetical protein
MAASVVLDTARLAEVINQTRAQISTLFLQDKVDPLAQWSLPAATKVAAAQDGLADFLKVVIGK